MPHDLFSAQAAIYAMYRPAYPRELFDYIISFAEQRNKAWDAATGNGQAAIILSEYFTKVEATDISEAQLKHAFQKPNIHYIISAAEQTPFKDNTFDLITVAQAYHWLQCTDFLKEATRVARPNAVVAIWGYSLPQANNEDLNNLIKRFYNNITGPYWHKERRFIDEQYESLPFSFIPLPLETFYMKEQWTKDQLCGYLSSWSAVQVYMKENNVSPLSLIEDELDELWPQQQKTEFSFPLFMRLGRVVK